MNHYYPIDDSEMVCAAEGCDNPYPCAQHQAFEAAACAPPFLLCNHGSSDAPRAGCTSAERCTAAGKCLAPPPAEDDEQTRQDAPPPEVYQLNPRRRAASAAPTPYHPQAAAAAGVPEAIEDAPTLRLPGRPPRPGRSD